MSAKAVDLLAASWYFVLPAVYVVAFFFLYPVRSGTYAFLRFLARPLLLLAVVALVYDGTRTLAGGSGLVITSLAEHWQSLAPTTLEALKDAVIKWLHPAIWEAGLLRLLRLPAWFVIGVLALALAWLGRKRQRMNIFVN
jgi:hypothetical protein